LLIDCRNGVARRQRDDVCAPAVEERISGDEQGASANLPRGCEGSVEFGFTGCVQDMNLLVEGARRLLDILQLGCRRRIVRIDKDSDQGCSRNQFAQQPKPLAFHLADKQVYSCGVASWPI
jgi:hypothetical protein